MLTRMKGRIVHLSSNPKQLKKQKKDKTRRTRKTDQPTIFVLATNDKGIISQETFSNDVVQVWVLGYSYNLQ